MTAGEAPAHLFTPVSINGLTLPNRVVMAPMTRGFAPDGVPGEANAAYYARRAAGGVGLIITEGAYIAHPAAGSKPNLPRLHGEEPLAGWRRVVEAVHAEGGRIAAQLWHVGSVAEDDRPVNGPVHSPSGLGLAGQPRGTAMTTADIDATVEAYAASAAAAHRVGFDGVELHGAHGYLLDAFLWDLTNRRDDGYGGSRARRARFGVEVVTAIRSVVPASFPLIYRTSQWKQQHYDARLADSPEALAELLVPIAEAGVDAFHASTRRYRRPEFPGSPLGLAGWIRKLTGIPTVAVGSVGLDSDFDSAESFGGDTGRSPLDDVDERLARGEFDLVAVGRALLGDPAWAAKIRQGRTDDVTPFARRSLATLD